jgi:hypothetical protein
MNANINIHICDKDGNHPLRAIGCDIVYKFSDEMLHNLIVDKRCTVYMHPSIASYILRYAAKHCLVLNLLHDTIDFQYDCLDDVISCIYDIKFKPESQFLVHIFHNLSNVRQDIAHTKLDVIDSVCDINSTLQHYYTMQKMKKTSTKYDMVRYDSMEEAVSVILQVSALDMHSVYHILSFLRPPTVVPESVRSLQIQSFSLLYESCLKENYYKQIVKECDVSRVSNIIIDIFGDNEWYCHFKTLKMAFNFVMNHSIVTKIYNAALSIINDNLINNNIYQDAISLLHDVYDDHLLLSQDIYDNCLSVFPSKPYDLEYVSDNLSDNLLVKCCFPWC